MMLAACAGASAVADLDLSSAIRPIPAGVSVQTDVTEYIIVGNDPGELTRSMRIHGDEVDGRRWWGTTRWRINWRWEYERQVTRCAFKDVRVTVSAQVDMPVWRPDSTSDPLTVEWWEATRQRLFNHEAGHVRRAVAGAHEIREATRFLSDGACDALGARANDLARNLLAKVRDAQAEYDRVTRHGARPDTLINRPR